MNNHGKLPLVEEGITPSYDGMYMAYEPGIKWYA